MAGWSSEAFAATVSPLGPSEHDVARSVPIRSLVAGDPLRLAGINADHANALAELDGQLPPILVHRPTMRVIDGMHRLCAAKLLGHEVIDVRFFDGGDEEAFVRAVQANGTHGLPLTLADRTAAADRIVRTHSHWSDRKIAGLVGLSPKTVGTVRGRLSLSEEIPQSAVRMGRDGRVRRLPVRTPGATAQPVPAADPVPELRPGAVRAPRSEKTQVMPTVHVLGQRRGAQVEPVSRRVTDAIDPMTTYRVLCQDPSFRLTETGRFLLRLLDLHFVRVREWDRLIANVPPHQASSVADLALACATAWREFAEKVAEQGTDLV